MAHARPSSPPQARLMRMAARALDGLKVPLALAALYMVVASVVLARLGAAPEGMAVLSTLAPDYIWGFVLRRLVPFFFLVVMGGAAWLLFDHLVRRADARTIIQRLRDLLRPLARPEPWVGLAVFTVFFMAFMYVFVQAKAAIPALQAFSWDPALVAWDRALHGGQDPWRLSWAVFDQPWATRAIDVVYVSWFIVVFSAPFASVMFDPVPARRMRFLTSHILVWIVLGSIGALAFSSVGPCYFGAVFGPPDPFAPLLQELARADQVEGLVAVTLQELLWRNYMDGSPDFQGISAMPSLHVAQVALLAFAARAFSRPLAVVAWVYTALIQLGSVHLGWHYAIDGYAGILGAGVVWWAVGWFTSRDRSDGGPARADAG